MSEKILDKVITAEAWLKGAAEVVTSLRKELESVDSPAAPRGRHSDFKGRLATALAKKQVRGMKNVKVKS